MVRGDDKSIEGEWLKKKEGLESRIKGFKVKKLEGEVIRISPKPGWEGRLEERTKGLKGEKLVGREGLEKRGVKD